jgi:hypothetical protein
MTEYVLSTPVDFFPGYGAPFPKVDKTAEEKGRRTFQVTYVDQRTAGTAVNVASVHKARTRQ